MVSYGKITKDVSDKKNREDFVNIMNMITSNEKIIYGGLPGPGITTISTDNKEAKVSHLNTNKKEPLAMIYFPDAKINPDSSINKKDFSLKINCDGASGNYHIHIQQNGKEIYNKNFLLKAGIENEILLMQNMKREDVIFVSVVPVTK